MDQYRFPISWTIVLLLFILLSDLTVVKSNFDPFTDSDLFSINWAGPLSRGEEEKMLDGHHVMVTTERKERYRCVIPQKKSNDEDEATAYTGSSAEELIQPLFKSLPCSYRLDSYWTYELCHGKHLKQYHETKEQGSLPRVQEFYLGFGNHRDLMTDEEKHKQKVTNAPLQYRELDGVELAIFEVIMDDGTKCDLTGAPRKAHVLYVCQPEGRGEIYELKESLTCEYEVIVFTSLLCRHPKYRPKTPPVSKIHCHSMLGSPLKPKELYKVEDEARYLQQVVQEEPPEVVPRKVHHISTKQDVAKTFPTGGKDPYPEKQKLGSITDKQTLRDFLKGHQCLRGGTGWWKHEVCYGKFARQFHIELGHETKIILGHWSKEKHIAWLTKNPLRKPKPVDQRSMVSLFYSDGDICDLTGKPRSCEVRIKCIKNIRNSHAVMLSLAEPEPCQYILTVESALFCAVMKDADEYGLFDHLDL